MKTLILLMTLFTCIASYSQQDSSYKPKPVEEGILSFADLPDSVRRLWLSGSATNTFTMKVTEPSKFIIMGRDVTEFLKVYPNGDVYYLPKAFCDCRKCRKYKGMKLLNYR